MRHSTLELTGRYTRPRMVDIEGAADALPSLRPTTDRAEKAAATGTDGAPIEDHLAHYLPTAGGGQGRELSDGGGMAQGGDPPSMDRNPLTVSGVDATGRVESDPVANAPRRTRTYNPLIKSQLLCQLS